MDPGAPAPAPAGPGGPLHLLRVTVPADWIDYNGHMNEARYLEAASRTTDALLQEIGAGLDHVATGFSYFTAETHLIHRAEARQGDVLDCAVQVLAADDKRLHVFVTIARAGTVLATVEQMMLHVDMAASRACPAPAPVRAAAGRIAAAHAALPRPAGAGRRVGEGRP